MVFRSYELKKNLLRKEVKRETLAEYKSGIEELENKGWIILAIVCDGKKGLLKLNKPSSNVFIPSTGNIEKIFN